MIYSCMQLFSQAGRMQTADPNDWYFVEQLRLLEEMDEHRELAGAAAVHFCLQHRIPAPEWAQRAGAELLMDFLRGENSGRRGRAAGYVARYREDQKDYDRWSAVVETREG